MVEMKKCAGECGLEKELNKENFQWRNKNFQSTCNDCLNTRKKNRFINIYGVIYRKCTQCDEIKELNKENFVWRSDNKKFESECTICNKKRKQERYFDRHDEYIEKSRKHYNKNKDEINKKRKNSRQKPKLTKEEKRLKKLERNRIYERNRRKNDPEYNLKRNISKSIRRVLKDSKGGQSVLKHLPYIMKKLREHIEKQFKEPGNEWMTWDNWGVYDPKTHDKNPTWNLDHIIPPLNFSL